jgi:DNA polymerase I-like protein with 3'-5' exonuclease and polymerase domains
MQINEVMSFDIETYDPNLVKMGPGVFRKDGYVLGVAIKHKSLNKYFNLRHYDGDEETRLKNIDELRKLLGMDCPKVGANILYDIDWLENYLGIKINGQLYDVQIAEALIDENQGIYNLDFLGRKYLQLGKEKSKIDEFCEENGLKGDPRAWLWKMPAWIVEPYALRDVEIPLRILELQWKIMEDEELLDLFKLECDLIRCLVYMRKCGVKVDVNKRDRNALKLQNFVEAESIKLYNKYGKMNINSSMQLGELFDRLGIHYPRTLKGSPSISKEFLKTIEGHDNLGEALFQIRRASKVKDAFLLGAFTDHITEGDLIHCSFYNTRTDQFGTRSGRLSSANPNLQQIPAIGVDEYYGKICREVFIPFDDHWWGKLDYSQIEYRFMAHFAVGRGSSDVRERYNQNPNQDYHQYIMDLTGLKRRFAKNLNFGVAYGMGARHMAEFFGWELDYAYSIIDTYHTSAPFIKSTIRRVEDVAIRRGYIRTFLKRRSRLIDRNKAYTMFCRLIQGSAADLMKKAMLECYNQGVFDVLVPHVTVHDELGVSVPKSKLGVEAFVEMRHIMEACIELKVPIKADAEIGPSWGELEEVELDKLYKEL